ncbi:response regulator receiver protein [Leptolyngbya sp. Heron Island J]|uniref:response regulator n=1 Tax=Leptolyngbya sp. Heron Island J TaxID=1385935 RepID=UPI0003B95989|nr:response regulator [Leptolyngbya sp. Heron Island J]ESA35457.1 response regulator receiver protein [Leptolyngbya sp. Heron Island J]
MTTQKPVVTISDFTAAKQNRLFGLLKQSQFNGQLHLTANNNQWTFEFYMGRLLYVTGGKQPMRRWYRYVKHFCPDLYLEISSLQTELQKLHKLDSKENLYCWEYRLLSFWYDQQKISRQQISQIIENIFIEVFFDINQARGVVYQVQNDNQLSNQLLLINAEAIIHKAKKLWQSWLEAKLGDRSPDLAPIIRHPLELKKWVPEALYRNLTMMLTGQQTLRDLSIKISRDTVSLSASLLPYIQQGAVELIEIEDLEAPVFSSKPVEPSSTGPLIACIDDSPAICRALERVLTTADYQTQCIQDPLRAIAILLARKPDLIFLDLVMPGTNGYELCSQLRKISCFKETPIIILTGNDGVIDRVRARMVGASAFLGKPINPHQVLSVVERQLSKQGIVEI